MSQIIFGLRPRWRKVLRDLWYNKARTLLVVISIAVGVFAVGAMGGGRAILAHDLQAQYAETGDFSARIFASNLDENFIDSIRRMPDIADAQGRSFELLRVKNDQVRSNLLLHGIDDFNDIRINTITYESGQAIPKTREIIIERASLALFNVREGDLLNVELPDGKKRDLRIVGVVHDVNAPPPKFANFGTAFASSETLQWLGFGNNYSEIRIRVKNNSRSRDHIQQVVDEIKERVEDSGRVFFGSAIQNRPGEHFVQEQVQTMLLILVVLGGLALFLSAFLVINTISAVMAQHIKQIGMMKAVGARFGHIVRMYLVMVLAYGALSLLIAVPLGNLGANALTGFVADLLNFNILTVTIPPDVLAMEIAVGLLIPMLASLFPIISGARITVRDAINSTGMGQVTGGDKRFGKLRSLIPSLPRLPISPPRPLLLSLRNTVRKKGRLLLTLGTLVLASAIFVSVFSVRDSLQRTLSQSMQYWNYDIEVTLAQTQAEDRVLNAVRAVPGVAFAEAWSASGGRRMREDKTEARFWAVVAPPAESKLIKPIIQEGRWLTQDDENAVVISRDAQEEESVRVGETIRFKIGARLFSLNVVGVAQSTLSGQVRNPRTLYINQHSLRKLLGLGREVGTVVVVTEQHDGLFQADIAKDIEEAMRNANMRVDTFETMTERREQVEFQFSILISFLLMMALLLAVVGGLGLTGTMSMNVLERTREIGVMRAIGANDAAIRNIVIIEGLLIGFISWALGSLLSYPISKLLSDQVGLAFLRRALEFQFSWSGLLMWLAIVLFIAAVASFFPAWRASRLTVREVLAYE